MEQFSAALSDIAAALTAQSRGAMQQVRDFFDVELAVADTAAKKQAVLDAIDSQRLALERLREQHKLDIKRAEENISDYRRVNEEEAAAWIDAIDDISLSKHHYQSIMDTVGDHHAHVADAVGRETSGFGYAGKRMMSVAVTYAALRHKLDSGSAFREELRAFRNEVGDAADVAAMADAIERAAATGVASESWISMSARNVAAAMSEVTTSQTAHMTSSWFSSFKFPTRETVLGRGSSSGSSAAADVAGATQKDIEDRFLAHVARRDYGKALEAMEAAIDHANVRDMRAGEAMRAHAESFRVKAADRIAVEHFRRYCDAAFLCAKFHFIEGVLNV